MNSYCGKDCEACAQRKKINCPGCQGVSKEAWPGRCSLAACAKAKGNRSCAQCIYATGCQKLKRKDREPMATLQRLQAEATGKRRKKEQAAFLGKWLWVLFWMFLPSLVAGLLTDPTLTAQFPQLSHISQDGYLSAKGVGKNVQRSFHRNRICIVAVVDNGISVCMDNMESAAYRLKALDPFFNLSL